jgi:O-antigen ligase
MTMSMTLNASRLSVWVCMLALAACVLWLPLGRPTSWWISNGVIALLVSGVLLNRAFGRCTIRHVPLLLAFSAVSLISAWQSPYAKSAFERGSGSLLLLTMGFAAAQVVARDRVALRGLQWAICTAIVACTADIAWQYASGHSLFLGVPAPADRWRFTGSLPNPNEVGFVSLLLPLALAGAPTRGGRQLWSEVLLALTSAFGVLLTGSRTTLGGLFIGACAGSWLGRRVFLRWSAVILLAVGLVAWAGDLGSFRKRLLETTQPQNEMRLQTWRIGLDAFLERPWLGQGPAVFFEVNEASRAQNRPDGWETPPGGMPWVHNVALELLVERGVVGFLLFTLLGWRVMRDAQRGLSSPSTRPWSVACIASLTTFAAMSMLDLTLLKEWCVICLAITAGVACQMGAACDEAGMQARETQATQGPP